MSDQAGTESRKTYTSFNQFRRVTSVVGLEVRCEKFRSGGYGSRHLDSDVLMIKFSVYLEPGSKELCKFPRLVFDVV